LPGLPTEVYERLARLLGLPDKSWACEIQSRWSRVHTPLSTVELARRLSQELPTAVSVSSFLGGKYVHTQRFITFDVDCKTDPATAGPVAVQIRDALSAKGIPSGLTYTGKKGFRNWVWLDGELPDTTIAAFQHKLLTSLGFTKVKDGAYSLGPVDCETLIGSGDGKIVKVPFSRHQDRAGYFEIPITPESITTIIQRPPTDDDWLAAVWAFESWAVIDPIDIALQTEEITHDTTVVTAPKSTAPVRLPDHRLNFLFDCAPCVRKITDLMKAGTGLDAQEKGFLVGSVLLHNGWSDDEIVEVFRPNGHFREEHTRYQLRHLRTHGYRVPKCDKVRAQGLCPGKCGRLHPIDNESPLKLDVPAALTFASDANRNSWFDNIVQIPDNVIILGGVRSGKTTGIGRALIRAHKKATIIVPRLSIIQDTWHKILADATAAGDEIAIAYVPDIRKMCVKLMDRSNKYPVRELLPRVVKPDCKNCEYKNCIPTTLEPNHIYGDAFIGGLDTDGLPDKTKCICGYQTVVQCAVNWDLVILSHKKFVALTSAHGDDWHSPLVGLITTQNLYVLDECTSYIETPELEFDIYTVARENHTKFKFVDKLKEEVVKVQRFIEAKIDALPLTTNGRRQKVATKLAQFKEIYKDATEEIEQNYKTVVDNPAENVFVLTRDITEEERGELLAMNEYTQRTLEHIAEDKEEVYLAIYDMMAANVEMQWIFSNDPSAMYGTRVTLKIAPKTVAYINAIKKWDSKIIALDIIPSIIPFPKLFDMNFKTYNLGDRGGLYNNFIIIPDSRHIPASKLRLPQNQKRFDDFTEQAANMFGLENIGRLFPSIRSERLFPDDDIYTMHQRGTKTIGVHCPQRIGISACCPFAPRTSQHWLKFVYPEHLKDISAYQLLLYEEGKQVQQGEGRFIDPTGKNRSVVLAWGQTRADVERSYTNAIVPPKILNVLRDAPDVAILQARIWVKHGVVVERTEECKALRCIMAGKDERRTQQDSGVAIDRVRELRAYLQ
jgi:hypothetical protein